MAIDDIGMRAAGRRRGAVPVEGLPGPLEHQVVDQGIARPRIEGDRVVASVRQIGDIGDAADVEQRGRSGEAGRFGQRPMERRNEWRTLPARRHIGGPQVGHGVDPAVPRQGGAVADLNG